MKYKTIMLDMSGYSKLAKAKETMRKRSGLKLSFNDLISEAIGKKLEFVPMEDELRGFVELFAGEAGKLEAVEGILMFGSVAKGNYSKYSDIDVMIVVSHKKSRIVENILAVARSLKEASDNMMDLNLPSLINPIILDKNEIKSFKPFYFDFADYGIILYERNSVITNFIYELKKIKHKRVLIDNVEVLTW